MRRRRSACPGHSSDRSLESNRAPDSHFASQYIHGVSPSAFSRHHGAKLGAMGANTFATSYYLLGLALHQEGIDDKRAPDKLQLFAGFILEQEAVCITQTPNIAT
jgi:hypothetical protein